MEKVKRNRLIGLVILATVLVICIHQLYNFYQQKHAESVVNKIYQSKGGLALLRKSFNIEVDAKRKTINIYPQNDVVIELKENMKEYVDDHSSTLRRWFTADDENDAGQLGEMNVTHTKIAPMAYAISSSNTMVKHWKINFFVPSDGMDRLAYEYQDSRFLSKPEDGLDKKIEAQSQEHDENAIEITKAVIENWPKE